MATNLATLRLRAVNLLGLTSALDMPGAEARVDEALNNVYTREFPHAMGDELLAPGYLLLTLSAGIGGSGGTFLNSDNVMNIDAVFFGGNPIRVWRDTPKFWEKWGLDKLTALTIPQGVPEDILIDNDVWMLRPAPLVSGEIRFLGRFYPYSVLGSGGIEESSIAKIVYTGAAIELAGELGMTQEIQDLSALWGRLLSLRGQKDKMVDQRQNPTLASGF